MRSPASPTAELSGRLMRWFLGLGLAAHAVRSCCRAAAACRRRASAVAVDPGRAAGRLFRWRLRAPLVALRASFAAAFGLAFAAMRSGRQACTDHAKWFPLHGHLAPGRAVLRRVRAASSDPGAPPEGTAAVDAQTSSLETLTA
jgi:hypothetical protein